MSKQLLYPMLTCVTMSFLGLTKAMSQSPQSTTGAHSEAQSNWPSPVEQRRLVKEAESSAEKLATKNSPQYFRVLDQKLLLLKLGKFSRNAGNSRGLRDAHLQGSTFADLRRSVQEKTAKLASLYEDKKWLDNYRRWRDLPAEEPLRIVGGQRAELGEYPDCVAVGSERGFCCSGTLVGKNVVLTAAHCVAGGCASRIFIGDDVNQPGSGRVIQVKRNNDGKPLALPHPEYDALTCRNDVALLILEQNVDGVNSPQIASGAEVDAAFYLRIVGFGYTNAVLRDYGVKSKADVFVASNKCDTQAVQDRYGCNAEREIVAGGNGVDTCNGDSGGPAYVVVDGVTKLAGVTSRATRNSVVSCGDGGNYARVDQYLKEGDRLFKLAKEQGARFD